MSSIPPRRAHHKSKLGCSTCKRRRVKCDEARPSCNNCVKRGVQCSFPKLDPKFRFSSPSTTSLTPFDVTGRMHVYSQKSGDISPSLKPPSLLDLLALTGLFKDSPDLLQPRFSHILHHFMRKTAASIAPPNGQAVWTGVIPQLAGNHLFVLQGIFAMGSLHLSRSEGSERDRRTYMNIAAGQLNVGLLQYRNAIENLTEKNAEAVFAFSTVTKAFVMTGAADDTKALLEILQNPTLAPSQRQRAIGELAFVASRVMHSMRGVMIFLTPYWYHFLDGQLAPLLEKDWWPSPVATTPEAIKENRMLHDLERIWMRPGRKYEYFFDHLAYALKQLRESFALLSQLVLYANSTGTPW